MKMLLFLCAVVLTAHPAIAFNEPVTAPVQAAAYTAVGPPSICLNASGFASVSSTGCPADTSTFKGASANAFNVLWNAWNPTEFPHPRHGGNMSTSFQTFEQMAEARLPFARVFASPWAWEDILLWRTATEDYWHNMSLVVGKAKSLGLKLHVSITPTLSQFAIAANCSSVRELITDEGGSACQLVVKEYVEDMVSRYKHESTILSWGMGNELNLEVDGCSYDKSDGAYFSTDEMMAFSRKYVGWIKALDPQRPVGSDMGTPRTRAKHLAAIAGGGAACVSGDNPKGDCEVNCTAVPKDSIVDFKNILAVQSGPFDYVSIHDYGCYPPFAEFSFCNGTSLATLKAAKEVADSLGKPLFIGEFGSPTCVADGWLTTDCLAYPTKLLEYQASSGIQLSNAWTWCQCPTADPCWCIDNSTQKIIKLLQATNV